jgi:hypothetical protein
MAWLHDAYRFDKRIVMVGLSLDQTPQAARKVVAKLGLNWTQGFLGARSDVAEHWQSKGVPNACLVGPDGKIIAADLRGDAIGSAVDEALRPPWMPPVYDDAKDGAEFEGVVTGPDGAPATGAVVLACRQGSEYYVQILDGQIETFGSQFPRTATDSQGRYHLRSPSDKFTVCIAHESGYAELAGDDCLTHPNVHLTAWAKASGVALVAMRPLGGAEVRAIAQIPPAEGGRTVNFLSRATADAGGNFALGFLPARAEVHISDGQATSAVVNLEPGGSAKVQLGGTGRPIVGKIELPAELAGKRWNAEATIVPNGAQADETLPTDWNSMSEQARRDWYERERRSGVMWASFIGGDQFPVHLRADGTFCTEDVPAGNYLLLLDFKVHDESGEMVLFDQRTFPFAVPPIPGGRSDEPLMIPLTSSKP